MKKRIATALILATSVLSAAAYADCDNNNHKKGAHKKHGAKKFAMIDENNDGKLSKEEMKNFHEKHFMIMDTDGDGFISQEEMSSKYKNRKDRKERKDGKGYSKDSDDE